MEGGCRSVDQFPVAGSSRASSVSSDPRQCTGAEWQVPVRSLLLFLLCMEGDGISGSIVMKQTLRALFLNYGEVLDVVAHRNLRMRGQAFVSFPDVEIAQKAQREVNRFPLYSKPMVCI